MSCNRLHKIDSAQGCQFCSCGIQLHNSRGHYSHRSWRQCRLLELCNTAALSIPLVSLIKKQRIRLFPSCPGKISGEGFRLLKPLTISFSVTPYHQLLRHPEKVRSQHSFSPSHLTRQKLKSFPPSTATFSKSSQFSALHAYCTLSCI